MSRRISSFVARLLATRLPTVILAGRSNDRPALCEWGDPVRAFETTGTAGYSAAIAGSLPEEGTGAWTAFRRLVEGERSTRGAEDRLTRAVRFCARHFGAGGPVNGTIFLRRLSCRFELTRVELPSAAGG